VSRPRLLKTVPQEPDLYSSQRIIGMISVGAISIPSSMPLLTALFTFTVPFRYKVCSCGAVVRFSRTPFCVALSYCDMVAP
jgi:hypothetical protein